MKYTLVSKTPFGGVLRQEFEGDSDLIGEFADRASILDDILLPWRIFDDRGNLVAEGKTSFDEETRMIKFANGLHTIRKGSVIEMLHGEPDAYQMRVDRFERDFTILKSLDSSWGRKDGEGEIWNVPCHLEYEYFVKY